MGTGRVRGDVPVCIPNAAPMPRMAKKMAKGTILGCSPLLRLSETENTTIRRTKVPTNWRDEEGNQLFNADVCSDKTGATLTSSKKQLTDDM